jgi:hypothetical protein
MEPMFDVIVLSTVRDSVSMTDTEPPVEFDTKTFEPSGVTAIP